MKFYAQNKRVFWFFANDEIEIAINTFDNIDPDELETLENMATA